LTEFRSRAGKKRASIIEEPELPDTLICQRHHRLRAETVSVIRKMGKLRHFFYAGLGIFILYMVFTHRSDGIECGSQIMSANQKCTTTTFRGRDSSTSTRSYDEQRRYNNGAMIAGGIMGVIFLLAGVVPMVARHNNMNAVNEKKPTSADYRGKLSIDFLEAVRGTVKRVDLPNGPLLHFVIPAGIEDGYTYFLPGIGGSNSEGGKACNVYMEVSINPHPLFTRSGLDISVDVPVSARDATEGAKVEVPTLTTPINLFVPKGAVNGHMLRLRGIGITCEKTGAVGHQYVRFVIKEEPAHAQPENTQENYNLETNSRTQQQNQVAEIEALIEELIQLGRSDRFLSENPDGHRTREIGAILDSRGGMDLMRFAYYRVDRVLGGAQARTLDVAWDRIGGWLG
jgi:hypothetical protein